MRSPKTLLPVPVHVEMINETHSSRYEVEQFIQEIFFRGHQANVHKFMPELLALRNKTGKLSATLGFRAATDQELFLECYLGSSIEDHMNQLIPIFNGDIQRDDIVEVGNLAASSAGGSRWLIIALAGFLQGAGYDWVTFTALPGLRNAFRKMGLTVIPLCEANKSCLPDAEQKLWGRYYDDKPMVVTVNVHHTYGVLEKQLRLENTMKVLQLLWHQAYLIGSNRRLLVSNTNGGT